VAPRLGGRPGADPPKPQGSGAAGAQRGGPESSEHAGWQRGGASAEAASLETLWIDEPGDAWRAREAELDAAGFPLPFWHRALGVACAEEGPWRLLVVRDAMATTRFGLAVHEGASRALPGHRILRVRRLGAAGGRARSAGLAALVDHARRAPRILRVEIGAFARDACARAELERDLAAHGFAASPSPRLYSDTLAVDLEPDEAGMLASFHKQTRKNLRRIEREPYALRAVVDPSFAPRLDELVAETMARTAGPYAREDWATRIAAAATEPRLSRLVGLFREPGQGAEALLAFGWACHHGDHVEYCTTASTRLPGSRLPLTYALAWDLIRWARASGARWFDFGGVTPGGLSSDDPLGGISDFKRSFSRTVVTVGSEWIFEPSPTRARVARAVTAARAWLSRERGGAA
jgi:hypothetical protein